MTKPQRLPVSSGVRTTGTLIGAIPRPHGSRRSGCGAPGTIAAACGTAWVIFNQLVEVANQLPHYQQNLPRLTFTWINLGL